MGSGTASMPTSLLKITIKIVHLSNPLLGEQKANQKFPLNQSNNIKIIYNNYLTYNLYTTSQAGIKTIKINNKQKKFLLAKLAMRIIMVTH